MNRLLFCALAAAAFGAGCGDDACAEESGIACTYIGLAGEQGFNGDGRDRLDTRLYWSMDMLFTADGRQLFIDWNNHLVRELLPDGKVQTIVGWTDPILPGDGEPSGAEYTEQGAVGTDVRLNHPTELMQLPNGRILLMAWHNHKLREIDPVTGNVRIICGGGAGFGGDGGPAADARLKQPNALAVDDDLNVYIGDQQNFRIRKVDTDGMITTIAGNGTGNLQGDPGGENIPALESSIDWEAGSNPEPSGGMVIVANKLYFTETLRHRVRVVDLDTGMIATAAGTGEEGFAGDGGPAAEAQFANPRQIEVGPDGDLYVADTDNSAIRAIDLTADEVRTVAGTGQLGLDPTDGLAATETLLSRPFGLEFDPAGNLFVMDTINSRILKVPR